MQRTKRQALGQHYLKDPGTLKKMIRLIDPRPEDAIIEIGAGRGALTFPLMDKAGRVIAIEKDSRLVLYLKERAADNLEVLEEDVLSVSFETLADRTLPLKLVGNLPYAISTPILFKVAEEKKLFSICWFLLQREVAERICSPPGSKKYAPLSIYFQNFYIAKIHFLVSSSSFSPPPKVESAFLSLALRKEPLFHIGEEGRFLGFLKTAFQHRRKKLLNNLLELGITRKRLIEIFASAGIGENARAEQVPLSRFVFLYERLSFE